MYSGHSYPIPPPCHYPPPLTGQPPLLPPFNGQYYPPLPPPPPLVNNYGWYPPPVPPLGLPSAPPPNYYPIQGGTHAPIRHRGGRNTSFVKKRPPTTRIIPCHTCNREYKSEETFQAHIQAHVKCDLCEYTALPKLVREHSVIHSLPDFLVFSTPEDTQRWRSERKKNYPTVANVAKKKQQESDKKDRRQVLDTPLYRYVNQLIGENEPFCNKRGRGHGRRGRGSNRGRWQSRSHLGSYKGDSSYNGDSEDLEEDNELVQNNVPKRSSSNNTRGQKRKRLRNTDVIFPKKPTLLEKLLCNEVRHEHNIILQCVHHIVSNNFWDQDGGK